MYGCLCVDRMKPKKVKEDDAPRTIACPHKVSALVCHFCAVMWSNTFSNFECVYHLVLKIWPPKWCALSRFYQIRDAPRCSGITLRWGSICTPMGPVCTSAPSAAKLLWRVQSWRGINSFTQARNLSRWVLRLPAYDTDVHAGVWKKWRLTLQGSQK